MEVMLGTGAVLTATAGLFWLMTIMQRPEQDWRSHMIKVIEKRGGKWKK